MKVLVVGSGGREHALARKFAEGSEVTEVFVSPGNGGTKRLRGKIINTDIAATNYSEIVDFSVIRGVDLVCIGPEQPIVDGLWEMLTQKGIRCVGPSQPASIVEYSKAWSKDFMKRNGIPTARYCNFTNAREAIAYIKAVEYPVVIKASGLAAGKGVILPENIAEAENAILDIMDNQLFGSAGQEVVIEERLNGVEVSLLAFCDGATAVCMPPAQDHKRAYDNDEGPNTGGMGAYAPAPILTNAPVDLQQQCADIVQRTVTALAAEGKPYQGVLYTGLMLTDSGPMVLEYNCRFGDPETQVLLPLLDSDLTSVFNACINGTLCQDTVKWKDTYYACTVVCAAAGYPNAYRKGDVISGLDAVREMEDVIVYHAGTKCIEGSEECNVEPSSSSSSSSSSLEQNTDNIDNNEESARSKRVKKSPAEVVTNGGRVLAVTGIGKTIRSACQQAYNGVKKLSFDGMFCRSDIAHRVVNAPLRVGVLGSTRGTDMQAIIDAIEKGTLNAEIAVCVSNKANTGILERARNHGIEAIHIGAKGLNREEYDEKVTAVLTEAKVDLVLLIGYMRIVSPSFVARWKWRCLNVHPSLLPDFAGGMDTDVHAAVISAGKTESGCTVHFVEDEVDGGFIVVQKRCSVDPDVDTPDTLKTRVQQLEGEALIEAINMFRNERIGPIVGGAVGAEEPITYKSAGVDIDAGSSLVEKIKPFCRATRRLGCNASLGGFGGLFDLQQAGLSGTQDTVLVSGADGVGTKLIVAQAVGKHDTVGIDLVAMNVNDIVVCGAQPLFFLDYFATGQLDVDVAAQVVSGIAEGCLQSGAALIGGETAEMAGMYAPGEYDLAGFCVGSVKRSLLLPRKDDMIPGDVLIGLKSSGLHSNGFSLVRKCVAKTGLQWSDVAPFDSTCSLGESLLCPTKIYVKMLSPLIEKGLVKGMAHITGGGLIENTPRMLPDHLSAVVDIVESGWTLPPMFHWLMGVAGISEHELLRTLNCGVGMVLVVSASDEGTVRELLEVHEQQPAGQQRGENEILRLGTLCKRPHMEAPQVVVKGSF